MNIRKFLSLVEIRTKIASLLPFVMGVIYSMYRYDRLNLMNTAIMFISMICFDMATTTINNYTDYKKASLDHNYKENTNIIGILNIKESTVLAVILTLLSIATIFGIWLMARTSIILLFIGAICFFVGIFYTFGPVPLSRMPLGEVFSGFFMGFLILFITIFVNIYDIGIIDFSYKSEIATLILNIKEVIYIFLVSIPLMMTIANLMLANNICDLEEDIINKRYTLPYYIGKKSAVKLFNAMYYIAYLDIILLMILKVFPIFEILSLLTFIIAKKNIDLFNQRQVKRETFVVAVRNLVVINVPMIVILAIDVIINVG